MVSRDFISKFMQSWEIGGFQLTLYEQERNSLLTMSYKQDVHIIGKNRRKQGYFEKMTFASDSTVSSRVVLIIL